MTTKRNGKGRRGSSIREAIQDAACRAMTATGGGIDDFVDAHVIALAAAICATGTPLENAIENLRRKVALGESIKERTPASLGMRQGLAGVRIRTKRRHARVGCQTRIPVSRGRTGRGS